ncbi:DUF2530 domain-containing protein [Glycomyces harbinensis]|uniref:DUF2530 domain-containing protein n=1 Tax=Glycomyces harbinensis TaxID=58114 RepID=A0A1G6YK21_9ACTN|nr:DUF2530 domain-containing protein [Glycomyces harbinensis]SDD90631.1 Protein of unknown function [Glycomyces harbinensis]
MSTDGTSQPPAASGSSATPREAYQRVKRSPELPAPDSAKLRMTPIAAAGTLLWTVALILTQLFKDDLSGAGREWWAACALTGVILGLIGTAAMAVADKRHASRPEHDGA